MSTKTKELRDLFERFKNNHEEIMTFEDKSGQHFSSNYFEGIEKPSIKITPRWWTISTT